jgi:hypothetical protein
MAIFFKRLICGMWCLCIALILALQMQSAWAGNMSGPDKVARSFYAHYIDAQPRGVPDDLMRRGFAPYLTPSLEDLLSETRAAEDAHTKATQNQESPFVEGDPFTSLFEGANAFSIEACTVEGARAYCDIALSHGQNGAATTTWVDKLALVKRVTGWKVDDIQFGAAWDFGQPGTLRGALAEVVRLGAGG